MIRLLTNELIVFLTAFDKDSLLSADATMNSVLWLPKTKEGNAIV